MQMKLFLFGNASGHSLCVCPDLENIPERPDPEKYAELFTKQNKHTIIVTYGPPYTFRVLKFMIVLNIQGPA